MVHQMVQKGALWPSVMITFGSCWHKVKLILPMVVALFGCWQLENVLILYIVASCMAQL